MLRLNWANTTPPLLDYDAAIRLDPNDANAYLNRGYNKIQLGQHSAAILDYDAAIRLDPNDAKAYFNRGYAKAQLGQHYSAIADYDAAIRLDPNYANAYFNRGYAKGELGRYPAAILDYDAAIRLDPNYAKALCQSGNMLREGWVDILPPFLTTTRLSIWIPMTPTPILGVDWRRANFITLYQDGGISQERILGLPYDSLPLQTTRI